MTDRFGFGWRPELAIDLHRHLDRIDILEFLAEEWFGASPARLDSLRAWCRLLPVHLHGTTLGLASVVPVEAARWDAWARLVAAVQPACWSEHLAFVRGGGIELGHLAAPPRTAATVAGALHNVARARAVVGSAPLLENIASLIDAPASQCDEVTWLTAIIEGADARMVLDLHNLHANATNGGWSAHEALERLPLARIAAVHVAGGRPWHGRVLDDHRHAVPDAVFELLQAVAARVPGPLDVILERDGDFPPIADLLAELDRARMAVAAGRAHRLQGGGTTVAGVGLPIVPGGMAVETFLARLYTDSALRAGFLSDPSGVARASGINEMDAQRLAHTDRHGLLLTADSLTAKRASSPA